MTDPNIVLKAAQGGPYIFIMFILGCLLIGCAIAVKKLYTDNREDRKEYMEGMHSMRDSIKSLGEDLKEIKKDVSTLKIKSNL